METITTFNERYFKIIGRFTKNLSIKLYNCCSGIEFKTKGDILINLDSFDPRGFSQNAYLSIFVNGKRLKVVEIKEGNNDITLRVESESYIKIIKNNEAIDNYITINYIKTSSKFYKLNKEYKNALVIGDSTCCGYGNLGSLNEEKTTKNSDATKAFPYLTLDSLGYTTEFFQASG